MVRISTDPGTILLTGLFMMAGLGSWIFRNYLDDVETRQRRLGMGLIVLFS